MSNVPQKQINAILVFENAFNTLEADVNKGLRSIEIKQKLDKAIQEKLPSNIVLDENTKQEIYKQVPGIIPHETERIGQFIPGAVLISFAIELALKVLIRQLNNEQVKGHRLDSLLTKLPLDHLNQIRDGVKRELGKDDNEIDALIEQNNNGFIDWRYFYEESRSFNLQFMKTLLREIKKHIDWKDNPQYI